MNRLFESVVASSEESAVSAPQWIQRQGPRQALAKVEGEGIGQLRPDVTVWTRDAQTGAPRIVRIVDAKWKQLDPSKTGTGVSQADLNQMLAYGLAYGCTNLELVYPTTGEGAFGQPLPRIDYVLPEGSGLEEMSVQIRAIRVD